LANLVQGTVCKILGQEEIKPHKVRYYLENRDAEFERKMAEVLCVYREVQVLKKASAKGKRRSGCRAADANHPTVVLGLVARQRHQPGFGLGATCEAAIGLRSLALPAGLALLAVAMGMWVMNFDAFHVKTKFLSVCSFQLLTASGVGVL
jgi:hypothetical protein